MMSGTVTVFRVLLVPTDDTAIQLSSIIIHNYFHMGPLQQDNSYLAHVLWLLPRPPPFQRIPKSQQIPSIIDIWCLVQP